MKCYNTNLVLTLVGIYYLSRRNQYAVNQTIAAGDQDRRSVHAHRDIRDGAAIIYLALLAHIINIPDPHLAILTPRNQDLPGLDGFQDIDPPLVAPKRPHAVPDLDIPDHDLAIYAGGGQVDRVGNKDNGRDRPRVGLQNHPEHAPRLNQRGCLGQEVDVLTNLVLSGLGT